MYSNAINQYQKSSLYNKNNVIMKINKDLNEASFLYLLKQKWKFWII